MKINLKITITLNKKICIYISSSFYESFVRQKNFLKIAKFDHFYCTVYIYDTDLFVDNVYCLGFDKWKL